MSRSPWWLWDWSKLEFRSNRAVLGPWLPPLAPPDLRDWKWLDKLSASHHFLIVKYLLLSVFGFVAVVANGATLSETPLVFAGMCDASAAVALSEDLFVVANDEDNLLRFYRLNQPSKPIQVYDLNPILSTKRKTPEADFEGAARLKNRLFWITSHGRTAKGKPAPLRHRLVAMEITEDTNGITIKHIGAPYTNLVADLGRDARFTKYGFTESARHAPKTAGALNIEALTDTPNGALLIGFRNPLFQGRAIVVPLLNPNEVVNGFDPQFGNALELDLNGLGLRGMGSSGHGYYLLAGPVEGGADSQLFMWKGSESTPQLVKEIRFAGINPEGLCFHDVPGKEFFLVLSDDGTLPIGGKDCKLLPESDRRFRGFQLFP